MPSAKPKAVSSGKSKASTSQSSAAAPASAPQESEWRPSTLTVPSGPSAFWKDGGDALAESKAVRGTLGLSEMWKYFFLNTQKNNNTKRYRARCRYCGLEMDGKTDRMGQHCSEKCQKITPEDRAHVLADIEIQTQKNNNKKAKIAENAAAALEKKGIESNAKVIAASTASAADSKFSTSQKRRADSFLTKAMLDAGVPLSFAQNMFFKRFIDLVQPAYDAPTRSELYEKLVPLELSDAGAEQGRQLTRQDSLTLTLEACGSLPGRLTCSIFASSPHLKYPYLLDVIDISQATQKLETARSAVLRSLFGPGLSPDKFKAVVSSSIEPLGTLRRELAKEQQSLLDLECFSAGIEQSVSEMFGDKLARETLRKSFEVVSFFSSSYLWGKHLWNWSTLNNVTLDMPTFSSSTSRFALLRQILKSFNDYNSGFQYCIQMMEGTRSDDAAKLPQIVAAILKDSKHSRHNQLFLKIMDLIEAVVNKDESSGVEADIAQPLVTFLTLYANMKALKVESAYESFKSHAMKILERRFFEIFQHPVYAVATYLHPIYRPLATSKSYTFQHVVEDILPIALSWKFAKGEVKELLVALKDYDSRNGHFSLPKISKDPYQWWTSIQASPSTEGIQALKKLALSIHGIVPSVKASAPVLSMLGYDHAAAQGHISTQSIGELAQARQYLRLMREREERGKKVYKTSIVKDEGLPDIKRRRSSQPLQPPQVTEPTYKSLPFEFENEVRGDSDDFNFMALSAGHGNCEPGSDCRSELIQWLNAPATSRSPPATAFGSGGSSRGWEGLLHSKPKLESLFDLKHELLPVHGGDSSKSASGGKSDKGGRPSNDDDDLEWNLDELSSFAAQVIAN